MDQDDVIKAFVAYRASTDIPGLVVDSWPDKLNSSTPDIDAIAGNLAIEHTSTEVVDGMREKNDWFMKAAGDLETELNPSMQFRLRINFDYVAVEKGQKWDEIKDALRVWIVNEAPALQAGYGYQVIHAPDVPFDLRVEKVNEESPLLVFYAAHITERYSRIFDWPLNN